MGAVNDSKKLSSVERERVYEEVVSNPDIYLTTFLETTITKNIVLQLQKLNAALPSPYYIGYINAILYCLQLLMLYATACKDDDDISNIFCSVEWILSK
jgi:hypothetical protein